MGQIVQWRKDLADTQCNIKSRIDEIIAVFRAIDAGELLAALPECDVARAQHTTALTLLALVDRELHILRELIDSRPG